MLKTTGKLPPIINPPERLSAQNDLWYVLERLGYNNTADKLGYTYSYVHQIANGKMPPSKQFAKATKNLAADIRRKENNRRPPPKRLSITFPGEPEFPTRLRDEFSMEELRQILRKAYAARHPQSDLPPFMAKNKRYSPSE